MKNKKAEEVIKMLEESNKTFTVELIGDKDNNSYGFAILIEQVGGLSCCKGETYSGITKETLDLLDEAEIKYKIIK